MRYAGSFFTVNHNDLGYFSGGSLAEARQRDKQQQLLITAITHVCPA